MSFFGIPTRNRIRAAIMKDWEQGILSTVDLMNEIGKIR